MFISNLLPKNAQFKPHISNKINATVYATERGWVAEHPNGQTEILSEARGLLTKLLELGYDKFGHLLSESPAIEDVPFVAPMTYTYYVPLIPPAGEEGEEGEEEAEEESSVDAITEEALHAMEWAKLKALAVENEIEGRSRKELVEGLVKFLGL